MTMVVTEHALQTYDVSRQYGRFFRHSIAATRPDGTTARFSAGVFRGTGTIALADETFQVGRATMSDRSGNVAELSIGHRILRLSTARITDLVQDRHFLLRQRRSWSSHLLLLEEGIEAGTFQSEFFESRYRVSVREDISAHVVLLSLWIAMVRGAFSA